MLGWARVAAAGLLMLLVSSCTVPRLGAPGSAAGSGAPSLEGELVVFAAASLTEAFTDLGTTFAETYPGAKVLFNFTGSQQLAQQLGQGAPADVFASANHRQMEAAVEAERVTREEVQVFVRNRLIVIYPAGNSAGLSTLADLAQPGLKLVLAAPEVPVGGYSMDFLEKASAAADYGADYSAAVLSNVASYEENVRAVLSKVVLGEADAGIVYTSDVAVDAQVGRIDIPDELNTIAEYPIGPIVDAEHPGLAGAFVELVLAPEGQAILAKHGFVPVVEGP